MRGLIGSESQNQEVGVLPLLSMNCQRSTSNFPDGGNGAGSQELLSRHRNLTRNLFVVSSLAKSCFFAPGRQYEYTATSFHDYVFCWRRDSGGMTLACCCACA